MEPSNRRALIRSLNATTATRLRAVNGFLLVPLPGTERGAVTSPVGDGRCDALLELVSARQILQPDIINTDTARHRARAHQDPNDRHVPHLTMNTQAHAQCCWASGCLGPGRVFMRKPESTAGASSCPRSCTHSPPDKLGPCWTAEQLAVAHWRAPGRPRTHDSALGQDRTYRQTGQAELLLRMARRRPPPLTAWGNSRKCRRRIRIS